jgi:hypothetical protein
MFNRDIGIIEDIEPGKFYCEGMLYVNENITEASDETISLSNMINKISFENRINQIINQALDDLDDKTTEERTEQIEQFIADREGQILDLIFFPDMGIRGLEKINLNDNSIVYIKVSENAKLGFFVNKTIAKYIFGGIGGE